MLFIMFEKLVFFMVVLNLNSLVASDDLKEKLIDGGTRGPNMWFGPRLGKRSSQLSPDSDRDSFYRMLEAADILKYYYNQLPYNDMSVDDPEPTVTKKVIFTPKMGRRAESSLYNEKRGYDLDFTPRLGRRLSDDSGVTPPDRDIYQAEQMDGRARYFSPRLGRSRNFSPRLGRNILYESSPNKVRVARSINKTVSN